MTGLGYDLHRLEKGKKLIIAGVEVDSEIGAVAHSDGDCALHAITDAILGAASMDDIGEHFPDNDPKYKNADSAILLSEVIETINNMGLVIINIDCTIILEKPKLKAYKPLMKKRVAEICNIDQSNVSIKAKTNERIGDIGNGKAIASLAVCQIDKK